MKLRIKMLLILEGIGFPAANCRERWSRQSVANLYKLETGSAIRFNLDHYLAALQFTAEELKNIDGEIVRFCKEEPEISQSIDLLCTIPGIGRVVTVYLAARIGDWRDLTSSRQIAALLGMIPVENSTGDRIRKGSISRMGDVITRSKLIETAWTSIRHDPELMEFYQRVKARNPAPIAGRKAIVAVARKLTARIYAVLKYQRPLRCSFHRQLVRRLDSAFHFSSDSFIRRSLIACTHSLQIRVDAFVRTICAYSSSRLWQNEHSKRDVVDFSLATKTSRGLAVNAPSTHSLHIHTVRLEAISLCALS